MKKIALFLLSLIIVQSGFAQDDAKRLDLRGPVKPTDTTYSSYKTYSLVTTLHQGIGNSLKAKKGAYSQKVIEDLLPVPGLRKVEKGDFQISYNVTRFELVEGEYVDGTYQRAPAYYIGMESNLEVLADSSFKCNFVVKSELDWR